MIYRTGITATVYRDKARRRTITVTITAAGIIGGANIVTHPVARAGTAAAGPTARAGTAASGPVARPGSS